MIELIHPILQNANDKVQLSGVLGTVSILKGNIFALLIKLNRGIEIICRVTTIKITLKLFRIIIPAFVLFIVLGLSPLKAQVTTDRLQTSSNLTSENFFQSLPALSLSGGITGWGGSLKQVGFEIAAGFGSRPVRFRPVWGKTITGTYESEWLGIEIQSYIARINNLELRLGIAGGRYSEVFKPTKEEVGNPITERDAVVGLISSARWLMGNPNFGTELEISLRWQIGINGDQEYHLPVLRTSIGISGNRPVDYSQGARKNKLAIYLGGGISPGLAKGIHLTRPLGRFGVDIYLGDLEIRLMSDTQYKKDLWAPSVGSAILIPVIPAHNFSLHLGGGVRWYNEIFEDIRYQTWLGEVIAELRYPVSNRLALQFTGERSWGFAKIGHQVRIDNFTMGLRYILW